MATMKQKFLTALIVCVFILLLILIIFGIVKTDSKPKKSDKGISDKKSDSTNDIKNREGIQTKTGNIKKNSNSNNSFDDAKKNCEGKDTFENKTKDFANETQTYRNENKNFNESTETTEKDFSEKTENEEENEHNNGNTEFDSDFFQSNKKFQENSNNRTPENQNDETHEEENQIPEQQNENPSKSSSNSQKPNNRETESGEQKTKETSNHPENTDQNPDTPTFNETESTKNQSTHECLRNDGETSSQCPEESLMDAKESVNFNYATEFTKIYSLFKSVEVTIEPNELFSTEDPVLMYEKGQFTNMPDEIDRYNASYASQSTMFESKNFQEFRNMVHNKLIHESMTSPTFVNAIKNDPPLANYTMNSNTCFFVAILYMLKQNPMLLQVIKKYSKDNTYYATLQELLSKSDGYTMTQEDFNKLTEDNINTNEPNFKFGEQADAVEVLETILSNKCDLKELNFQFGGHIYVKNGEKIAADLPEENTVRLKCIPSNIPILTIIPPETGEFAIQRLLAPQKVNDGYSVPLFFNTPPFLVIKIIPGPNGIIYRKEKVNVKLPIAIIDNEDAPTMATEEQTVYKIHQHGNCIINEEITIYSVNASPTKYRLTGFLVYQVFKTYDTPRPSGHYIPFFKTGDQWYGNYYDFRGKAENIVGESFKFKNDDTRFISSLYYERVDQ